MSGKIDMRETNAGELAVAVLRCLWDGKMKAMKLEVEIYAEEVGGVCEPDREFDR